MFANPRIRLSSFVAVGAHYLRVRPDEADVRLLKGLLFEDGAPATFSGLRRAILRQSSADFQRGDLVLLEGWILARSEARVCALASLAVRHGN